MPSKITRPEQLPSSAECFVMIIRKRWVELIACSERQGREHMKELDEYRATWTEEGRRNTRVRLVFGKPILSPRKRYTLTTARDFFYNWRLRQK